LNRVVRSRTRWYEQLRRYWTGDVPYRCIDCRWRDWEMPREHASLPASRANVDVSARASHAAGPGESGAVRRRERQRAQTLGVAGGFAIVLSVLIVAFAGLLIQSHSWWFDREVSNTGQRSNPAAAPVLSLQSTRAYQDDSKSLWLVDGQIKNLSSEPLAHIEAVSTWLDRDGLIVATDRSLVDVDRMMPGQVAAFRLITRTRPGFSRFEVQFRSEAGMELAMTDESTASKVVAEPEPAKEPPAEAVPAAAPEGEKPFAVPAAVPVR
jgi:hypothetical protein